MLVALLTLILLTHTQAPTAVVQDAAAELSAARQLYASAAYEEALDRLARLKAPDALADQIDTYRALCLLALGRSRESEQVVERLLTRNPRYVLDEGDVSPRLVIVFRAVRARLLPSAARNLYAVGLASFEAKNYDVAIRQFREVLTMIDADPVPDSSLSDLKLLADGFIRQAEAARRAAAPLDSAFRGAGDVSTTGVIYSILDRDVIPPVEVSRPIPIMDSPRGEKPGTYQGLVEIVIGETGRVEQVAIRKPIHPSFDAEVIASTGYWRFRPATKDGKPVKYRRAYEIIGHSR
jgi:tetratricopeptide (TPR) repeat protein